MSGGAYCLRNYIREEGGERRIERRGSSD